MTWFPEICPDRRNETQSRSCSERTPASSSIGTVVLGVTDPVSLRLMRGHPAHLAERGWTVHVVTGGTTPRVAGAICHELPMRRNPSPLRDLIGLVRWAALTRRIKPNVVMLGTPKAGLLGIVAAWLCRVPRRIYVLRGLRLEGTTGPASWLLWALELVACRLATDVLAVSSSLAQEAMARRLTPAGRVHVLGSGSSNGVDTTEFAPPTDEQKSAARGGFGLLRDSRVVGFVGRLHTDKGIDTLISALSLLDIGSSPVLLLAGQVETRDLQRDLETKLASAGVRVQFLGHVENPVEVFWAMDVLALPSRREGFPNVVLEAAACGVPAVVSDATGCRDSVINGNTGWIVPVDSPSELAAALESILTDEVVLATFGAAARTRALTEFHRELVWRRIDRFLSPIETGSHSHESAAAPLEG